MENKKKIVMFDFDGVLVNTIEFIFKLNKEVNKELTWEIFQDFSNGNFHSGIEKATKDGIYKKPDDWDNIYSENIEKLTIHDILNQTIKLLSKDCVLSIVSSSSTSVIKKFLNKENIDAYFSDIYGTDVNSMKSVKIKMLLDKYSIPKEDAVFITDSLGDIHEANECGIKSIGVTWGIHKKDTLSKGNPELIIEDPRDLLVAIKNVLKL